MAKLQELLLFLGRAAQLWAPVHLPALTIGSALYGIDDAALPRIPHIGTQEMPAANQRHRGGNKPMYGVEISRPLPVQRLRPVGTQMLRRPFQLLPQLVSGQPKQIRPALIAGALVQEQCGEQCSWGSPHQLASGVINVADNQIVQRGFECR